MNKKSFHTGVGVSAEYVRCNRLAAIASVTGPVAVTYHKEERSPLLIRIP